jgi:A/G-specific adenine glycosylase
MMDLGALVCLPTKPQCNVCPLKTICKAYRDESQEKFPRKKAKAPKRNRYFHFLKITDGRTLILEKRNQKDIWQGLYQMPLIEKSNFSSLNPNEIQAHFLLQAFKHIDISAKIVEMKQTLSHQIIQAKIYTILINSLPEDISKPFYLVNQENLNNYALPKILDWYFDEK